MTTPSELIFISYARKDTDRVRPIYETLKDHDFALWFDQVDLLAGQRWEDKIVEVIRASRVFLLFLSSSWVESRSYVQRELKIALDVLQELPSDQVFIVSVRLDECNVPSELSELHWMDLWNDAHLRKLLKGLTKIIKGEPAEFFIQSPIVLGNTSIKKGSQMVLDNFYDLLVMSAASDKINQTVIDGQEHSVMITSPTKTDSYLLDIIHVHPGSPTEMAPGLRGIFTKRINTASPFLSGVAGIMMLDFFVEKMRPSDLQSLRISVAVTFLPLKEELPKEVSFAVAHKEMMTESEWQQIISLYEQS